uniref:Uncharacterized protein n=1 Tax=Anguilla anguilla TaxID=7936 RepID=A0A0E9T6L1_ANGAN
MEVLTKDVSVAQRAQCF